MNSISDLLQGYRAFRDGSYQQQAELYESLGKGQSPNVMIIGCADSRAEPADIFSAAPGQLFVVRNVANLVPPYEETDGLHGVSAALEFAVGSLKVGHIVVMGHGGCGGVNASLSAAEDRPVGQFVGPWVQLLDSARDEVLRRGSDDPQTDLELAGVGVSISLFLYRTSRPHCAVLGRVPGSQGNPMRDAQPKPNPGVIDTGCQCSTVLGALTGIIIVPTRNPLASSETGRTASTRPATGPIVKAWLNPGMRIGLMLRGAAMTATCCRGSPFST